MRGLGRSLCLSAFLLVMGSLLRFGWDFGGKGGCGVVGNAHDEVSVWVIV